MEIRTIDCEKVLNSFNLNEIELPLDYGSHQCFSDENLVKMFVEYHDEEAFNELVNRHGDKIFRTAYRITGDHAAAEDVLQNVFLILSQNLGSFRNDSKFSTWLYRVASNTSLMYLRSKKKFNTNEIHLEDVANFDESGNLRDAYLKDWSDLPDDKLLSNEGIEKIEEAIEKLPPKYREVFTLRDIEGLSNKEVADALDLSIPAVKSRLLRARLFLRDKLSDYYYEFKNN